MQFKAGGSWTHPIWLTDNNPLLGECIQPMGKSCSREKSEELAGRRYLHEQLIKDFIGTKDAAGEITNFRYYHIQ